MSFCHIVAAESVREILDNAPSHPRVSIRNTSSHLNRRVADFYRPLVLY